MEEDVKERIRLILKEFSSNPTQLSRQFNVNQKTLNSQINDTTTLSVSTILLILKAFPDVSAEWLLRGSGNTLILDYDASEIANRLRHAIDKTVDRTKIGSTSKDIANFLEVDYEEYKHFFVSGDLTRDFLEILEEKLGIDPLWIFTGEGTVKKPINDNGDNVEAAFLRGQIKGYQDAIDRFTRGDSVLNKEKEAV